MELLDSPLDRPLDPAADTAACGTSSLESSLSDTDTRTVGVKPARLVIDSKAYIGGRAAVGVVHAPVGMPATTPR